MGRFMAGCPGETRGAALRGSEAFSRGELGVQVELGEWRVVSHAGERSAQLRRREDRVGGDVVAYGGDA